MNTKHLHFAFIMLAILVVPVSAADPWDLFIPPSISGDAPYTVTFVSISHNTTAWNWSFRNVAGNNTEMWFSQSPNVTYTFNYNGSYLIKLNASNSEGYDITSYNSYVYVNGTLFVDVPVADFTGAAIPSTKSVAFSDTSDGIPTAWKWEYLNEGDGGWAEFSTAQNPTYTFVNGLYDINLTVTNSAGTDSELKVAYLSVSDVAYLSPEGNISVSPSNAYKITNMSWLWAAMVILGILPIIVGIGLGLYALANPAYDSAGYLMWGVASIAIGTLCLVVIFALMGTIGSALGG